MFVTYKSVSAVSVSTFTAMASKRLLHASDVSLSSEPEGASTPINSDSEEEIHDDHSDYNPSDEGKYSRHANIPAVHVDVIQQDCSDQFIYKNCNVFFCFRA
jgi:hypothetical protein